MGAGDGELAAETGFLAELRGDAGLVVIPASIFCVFAFRRVSLPASLRSSSLSANHGGAHDI